MAIKSDVIEAVSYYVDVTNETVSQFLEKAENLKDFETIEDEPYNDWLLRQITKLIKSKGVSINELVKNKDLFMGKGDKEEDGSFYTPLEWAKETHDQLLRYVPNLEDYIVWDASCGSGNLVAELPKCKKLYVSTLHEEDVEIVQTRLPHAHAFQLDFLTGIDYNPFMTEFTDMLPQELQDSLRNREPIIFLMNPPYSVTNAQKTQLSKHLRSIGESNIGNDLLRQFIWRVYNLIDIHGLTDSYFSLVGTNSLYILPSWESTVRVMQEHADYLDGFTYPASEFAGVSKSLQWGIFSTLWKTLPKSRTVTKLPNIQMDEMKKDSNGVIQKYGKLDFVWDKKYITDWVNDKITEGTRKQVISVDSKGVVRKENNGSDRVFMGLDNALGYIMLRNTFKDISQYNALSTTPIIQSDIPMTHQNIKEALGVFAFTSTFQEDFNYSARPFNEPVTGTDEYKEWLANSYYFAICARKSFLSSFRGIEFGGETININNTIFPFSADQVKTFTDDPKILQDIEDNPIENQWYLDLLENNKHLVWDETMELFNAVTGYIKASYNARQTINYQNQTQAWNAGFVQLKYTTLWDDNSEDGYTKLLNSARQKFRSKAKTHFIV